MNKVSVVLIGVGGIGFRHFQSLLTFETDLELTIVDINNEALERAHKEEINVNNKKVKVSYCNTADEIQSNADVAIIATSSLIRRMVFENLIANIQVRYVIFEKFLFPKEEDYSAVNKKLIERGIMAYVNCPGRLYPGYIRLKEKIGDIDHLYAVFSGTNWGLSCNIIHYIDQIAYLINSYDELKIDASQLDSEILNSKRNGYIEFTGRLVCQIGNRANIVIDSEKSGEASVKNTIFVKNAVYTISEGEQWMITIEDRNAEKSEFPIFYQSQLTSEVIKKLAVDNSCELTRYEDSMQWHKAILRVFRDKYNSVTGKNSDICPIT